MTTRPRSSPRPTSPKTTTDPSLETVESLPGFTPPPPETTPPADPIPETTTVTAGPLEDPSSEASDDDPADKASPSSTTGSSPASFADKRALTKGVRRVVGLATLGLHTVLDPGEDGCWLADQQDLEEIGDPLTSLLVRHAPISAGRGGDVGDGLSLLGAVGGYLVKNLQRRAIRRGAAIVDEHGNLVPAYAVAQEQAS